LRNIGNGVDMTAVILSKHSADLAGHYTLDNPKKELFKARCFA
jgi:hypothetical protein